jgi:hypothetical protein
MLLYKGKFMGHSSTIALYRLDSGNCKLSFFLLCLLSLGRSAALVFFEDKGKLFSD